MTVRANIADILCIGCQKGSTSWLHSVLACHPRTHSFPNSEPVTSTDKEAHFWDWNHARGVDWYRSLLAPPDPAMLTLDFTPEYAFLTEAQIAECRDLNPTAKVVYVLRDPLARALSALRMHLLWRHGRDWRGTLDMGPALDDLIGKARLDLHGDYTGNIRRWRRAYPDLKILNYEDFHAVRAEGVAALMGELGLDPAGMSPEGQARLDGLMGSRVWESTRFPVSPRALHFLDGFTREWRAAAERDLGLRWTEGARLLAGG